MGMPRTSWLTCLTLVAVACSGSPPATLPTGNATEANVRPGVNDAYFEANAIPRHTAILEARLREVVKRRDAIIEELGLRKGMVVADIGAGTGLFTNAIAEAVGPDGRVFAVDIVPAFLSRVEDRARQANLSQITVVLGDKRGTALPRSTVDLAFMSDTYHHLEYPRTYLRSVLETLRPQGELVLIDLERIEGKTHHSTLQHVRAGKETVIDEVTEAGFVLDKDVDLLERNYFLRFVKP